MNDLIQRVLVVTVISIASSANFFAQDKPNTALAGQYVVSAKAGGVNYAEGDVTIKRSPDQTSQLRRHDRVEIGERVATGATGKAEILLNPGSYLRIGANTSFEFGSTDLDNLEVKLFSGSSMFEVFATNEFVVTILTPGGSVAIVDSGVYRIDVFTNGVSTLSVFEGKAQVGYKTSVKAGRSVTLSGASASVVKFDRKNRDELAEWSRSRAKDQAKMTYALKNKQVRESLITSFNGGRWGLFDSFGLWVFDPFRGGYCFLPFGRGWYSPYGYNYGLSLYWFNMPPTVRYYHPTSPVVPNGPTVGTGTPVRTIKTPTEIEPPYSRIERTREPQAPLSGFDLPDASTPIRQAPILPSAPVTISAPSTNRSRKEQP